MATFMSGTDTNTLQEEGSYKNNFVSLIVNNEGTYTAAITRHVFCEVKNNISYSYEMFGDGTKTGQDEGTETKEYIEYFMMAIHKPEMPENTLDTRIDEILEKKRKASVVYSYNGNQNAFYNDRTSYDLAHTDRPFYCQEDNDVKEDSRQMNILWEEPEFNEKQKSSDINEKALITTMARLLTGSITCNVSEIKIDSWIENYDKVYSSKFDNLIDYSEWLAPYLEYLMYHIPGVSTDIIDDVVTAIYANEIISRIGKPKGEYSKELLDQLNFYGTL